MLEAFMRKTLFIPSIILTFLAIIAANTLAAAPVANLDGIISEFKSPDVKYGSAPFWSWNEKLEPAELRSQVDEFKSGGMGGFFMHGRVGLITTYMSEEWMNGVRASIDQAKKNGMLAYLYDENGYPSGTAGGAIPRMNPDYMIRGLLIRVAEKPLETKDLGHNWKLIRVFEASIEGQDVKDCKDITPEAGGSVAAPAQGKTLLYFYRVIGGGPNYVDGASYIDAMNPKAVKAFIDYSYEPYKKAFGNEFGKTIPAVFTDEPMYHNEYDMPGALTVPWTDAMPDTFKKRYGYSIEDKLPLIFYNGPGAYKARLDFWTNATEMYRDAYGRQIYEWCERNNIKFTGHYFGEESYITQMRWTGAAMPMYEFQQMPGMDHLGRNIKELLVAKQVSSVAHQFERPLVLTEIYGCSGWNLSFENMKWIADWHYALGVNFMTQHLSYYSMRGCRKRDYPPCIQYQQPWWRYHKIIADYLRRATFITSQGKYVADTLVIHNISSAWAANIPGDSKPIEKLCDKLISLITYLTSHQVDYDLGDEIIIANHGSVNGNRFIVNKMSYSSVVVSPGVTLRAETVKLLKEFEAGGGQVVMVEPAPSFVDGDKPFKIDGAIVAKDNADAVAKLSPYLKSRIEVTPNNGETAETIYIQQRDINGSKFVFFVNTDQGKAFDATAKLPYEGLVREWKLFDGTESDYPSAVNGGKTDIHFHLQPAGSFVISITPGVKPSVEPIVLSTPVREGKLSDTWKIVSQDLNSLTIDYIDYKLEGDSNWTLNATYYETKDALEKMGSGKKFNVRYDFKINADPKGFKKLFIAVEQPEKYEIAVNGKRVVYTDEGWWRDKSFKLINIRDIAVEGKNAVELSGIYATTKLPGSINTAPDSIEVEAAYVVGDFSVRPDSGSGFAIKPQINEVKNGNLASRGFPFFSGSIVLSQNADLNPAAGEKVFLELDGLEAIAAKVFVNGAEAGLIAFHPHRIDITRLSRAGSNLIEFELTGSNRNLLGPHHNILQEPLYVSPRDFEQNFTKSYNFVPFGITGGVRVSYYR